MKSTTVTKVLRQSKSKSFKLMQGLIETFFLCYNHNMKEFAHEAYLALELLNSHNKQAYLVGGAVRDLLLKRPVSDYDITTNANPDEIRKIFKDHPHYDIGRKHGCVAVNINGIVIEITPFRKESDYLDHRHPNRIEFVDDLKEDLSRRDLTINALCLDANNRIIDLFDGQKDLKNRILRAIGDPNERYKEDALRTLRTIRFSVQLGFSIEEKTKDALFANKELLSYISMERKKEELFKILQYDNTYQTINEYLDVFRCFIPLLKPDEDIDNLQGPYEKLAYLLKDDKTSLVEYKFSKSEDLLVKTLKEAFSINVNDDYEFIRLLANDHYQKELLEVLNHYHNHNYAKRYQKLLPFMVTLKNLNISGDELMKYGYRGKDIRMMQDELLSLIHCQKLNNDPACIKMHLLKKCYTR